MVMLGHHSSGLLSWPNDGMGQVVMRISDGGDIRSPFFKFIYIRSHFFVEYIFEKPHRSLLLNHHFCRFENTILVIPMETEVNLNIPSHHFYLFNSKWVVYYPFFSFVADEFLTTSFHYGYIILVIFVFLLSCSCFCVRDLCCFTNENHF